MPLIFVEGRTGRIHLTTEQRHDDQRNIYQRNAARRRCRQMAQSIRCWWAYLSDTAASVYPLDLMLTDSAGTQTPLTVNIQVVSGGYALRTIQLMRQLCRDLLDPTMEDDELATAARRHE